MVKSIGGKWAVRCIEVVRFLEGPLLEVLVYTSLHELAAISRVFLHKSAWYFHELKTSENAAHECNNHDMHANECNKMFIIDYPSLLTQSTE